MPTPKCEHHSLHAQADVSRTAGHIVFQGFEELLGLGSLQDYLCGGFHGDDVGRALRGLLARGAARTSAADTATHMLCKSRHEQQSVHKLDSNGSPRAVTPQ